MTLPLKAPRKTILVVEDTALVLNTVRMILENANFHCAGGRQPSNSAGPLRAGPCLKLKESRPEMRVILMSGYPGGGMLVLNYGWYSIQKPFVRVQLVAKSNEVLYAEMRDRSGTYPDS